MERVTILRQILITEYSNGRWMLSGPLGNYVGSLGMFDNSRRLVRYLLRLLNLGPVAPQIELPTVNIHECRGELDDE